MFEGCYTPLSVIFTGPTPLRFIVRRFDVVRLTGYDVSPHKLAIPRYLMSVLVTQNQLTVFGHFPFHCGWVIACCDL